MEAGLGLKAITPSNFWPVIDVNDDDEWMADYGDPDDTCPGKYDAGIEVCTNLRAGGSQALEAKRTDECANPFQPRYCLRRGPRGAAPAGKPAFQSTWSRAAAHG